MRLIHTQPRTYVGDVARSSRGPPASHPEGACPWSGSGSFTPWYRYPARMAESDAAAPAELTGALADRDYREAVVDLLAVVAYGELSAFERLVEDAKLAPTLEDKLALAQMAGAELAKVQPLIDRISKLGGDPFAAMAPFHEALDEFHAHTAPADWHEGLVKAFVGDSLARDFYREIAAFLDPDTRDLVVSSVVEGQHSAFAVDRLRQAIADDPPLGGRLALWGRRLMGEALIQAQRVAADRDALTALLVGGVDRPGLDLAALGRMFTRLTERHSERMAELGLDP